MTAVVIGVLAPGFAGADEQDPTTSRVVASTTLSTACRASMAAFRRTDLYRESQAPEDAKKKPKLHWQALVDGGMPAPAYYRFSGGGLAPEAYRANRRLAPGEMALMLQQEYGHGSMLGLTANALAGVAIATEKGTQVSLDGVNLATDTLIEGARDAFNMPYLPDIRLRSTVQANRLDIGVKKTW